MYKMNRGYVFGKDLVASFFPVYLAFYLLFNKERYDEVGGFLAPQRT